MNLINATPHKIRIMVEGKIVTLRTSSAIARVETTSTPIGEWGGIEVRLNFPGKITGLPEEVEGTYFIVSKMVLDNKGDRNDLFALDTNNCVRDKDGHIDYFIGLIKR